MVSGRTVWVLCVDALILSIDGSLLDALSIAIRVRPSSIPLTGRSLCYVKLIH